MVVSEIASTPAFPDPTQWEFESAVCKPCTSIFHIDVDVMNTLRISYTVTKGVKFVQGRLVIINENEKVFVVISS